MEVSMRVNSACTKWSDMRAIEHESTDVPGISSFPVTSCTTAEAASGDCARSGPRAAIFPCTQSTSARCTPSALTTVPPFSNKTLDDITPQQETEEKRK